METKIKYLNPSGEELTQIEIIMNRTNNENEEGFEMIVNTGEEESDFSVALASIMQLSQWKVQVNTELVYKQNITEVTINIENNTTTGQNFEKKQTLGLQNSRSLNSIESEKRKGTIDQIKSFVLQKTNENVNLLIEKLKRNNSVNEDTENKVSQTEINKFNAKFEFYTGEEVSADNVKMLLDVAKNNLKSYEFLNNEISNNTGNTKTEESKINIKLNIEKNISNEEGINKVLEKINTNKKYKVSIKYNEGNGLIEYITITEI